jgi:hypothetical protein
MNAIRRIADATMIIDRIEGNLPPTCNEPHWVGATHGSPATMSDEPHWVGAIHGSPSTMSGESNASHCGRFTNRPSISMIIIDPIGRQPTSQARSDRQSL